MPGDRPAGAARQLGRLLREQWLDPAELERRQWARVRRTLAHAWDRSPFYRERWRAAGVTPDDIRSSADLVRLPVTTREDLHDPERLLVEGVRRERLRCSTTSGSTGRPTRTWFDRRAWRLGKVLLKLRARLACGMRPWHRTAVFQERDAPRQPRGMRVRSFSVDAPIDVVLPALTRYRPQVLYGFPSCLARLAEHAAGVVTPALVFTSGELLDGTRRRSIEAGFGAPVYDVYGCTELKEIAWECPHREGYHVNADWMLVETLGDPGAGEGELLITSLYHDAMPLVRYALGDTGRLLDHRCPCGRGLPLMVPTLGRSVDYFFRPDGQAVAPYTMTCAIEGVRGMRQYQIRQERPDRVVVRVVPGPEFDDAAARRIVEALAPVLPGMSVVVERVRSIAPDARGKYRIVVSSTNG